MDTTRTPEQSEHTGQAPSIAEHRPNRFELHSITVTANGLRIVCTERGVHGSAPPPLVLTEGEHLLAHHIAYAREAADELEKLFEARFLEHATAQLPAETHKAIQDKLEAQAALAKLNAELEQKRAELADVAATHGELTSQIAQVQSIFAATKTKEPPP